MDVETVTIEGGRLARPAPDTQGVRCYRGIPYAAPPQGPWRWRAPQRVAPWPGVRSAQNFGPASMQGQVFDDIDTSPTGVSEDCLYLNVWTPAETGEGLATLFWIHGGGFAVGSGAEPRYDGARLAARGILVVTVNHRLNALGFLAHPELSAEGPEPGSGHYGLLDLIAALGWVRRNIARFGGDPAKVTIAGESAGSMAVSALMASPLARGLFRAAIGQSGALFPSPTRAPQSLEAAHEAGLAFASKFGAESAPALRRLSAQAILDAAPGIGFFPVVDGHVLPLAPAEAFARGAVADVPLLAGWNKDEGFNFDVNDGETSREAFAILLRKVFGEEAGAAQAFYPAETPAASGRRLGGDLVIVHGAWSWIESHKAAATAPIYRYRFDQAPRVPEGWFGASPSASAGAFHAAELVYMFDNLDAFPWASDDEDRRLADLMAAYWVNFVKHGDPNGAGLPRWPDNRAPASPLLALGPEPKVEADDEAERHRFLARVTAARQQAPK